MATNVSDPAARQYAQALLMIGQERNIVGQIFEDLSAIDGAYREDKGFRNFFTSPKIAAETKLKIVKDSLGDKVCEEVMNFIGLLIRKRREPLLDNVMDAFAKNRDEAENRVHVFVESAKALDDGARSKIQSGIAKATGKEVVMHEAVNEELIGGVRVRVGDRLLDGTILRSLKALSQRIHGESDDFVGAATRADVDELYERSKAEATAAV